jgi:hypothetical protein
MSALLTLAGPSWIFGLPQMTLDNTTEYTSLEPGIFMQGEPSAFDVIAMIARGYGAGYTTLGWLGGDWLGPSLARWLSGRGGIAGQPFHHAGRDWHRLAR